jgi:hypothetical protein
MALARGDFAFVPGVRDMRLPETTGVLRRLDIGRRASVTMWLAVLLPGLVILIAMGVEIAGWEATQVSAQRSADVSALAGSINFQSSKNAQTAATFAARMAQLNGGAGTASPSWDATSKTLTDNQITVQVVSGIANSSDDALQVTFHKIVPATLSTLFSSVASYTVTGTSTAELVSSTVTVTGGASGGGGQPCLLALAGNTGITSGTHMTFQGSADVNVSNCSVRSNDGVSVTGSATLDSTAIYAGGQINVGNSSEVTGTKFPGQGQIGDPYASDTALQSALHAANTATGSGSISCKGNSNSTTCTAPGTSVSCSGTSCTLQPGTYTSMNLTSGAILNFSPGLYTFTDNVVLGGGSTLIGQGVTMLLAAGTTSSPKTLSVDGSAIFVLSAATTTSDTNGQFPGITLASLSTGTTQLYTGNSNSPFIGVVYYPNGQITYAGNNFTSSPGCSEIIAKTINMTGNSTFDSTTCLSYGATSFTNVGPVKSAHMVR